MKKKVGRETVCHDDSRNSGGFAGVENGNEAGGAFAIKKHHHPEPDRNKYPAGASAGAKGEMWGIYWWPK